jgi:uncharacterized protein YjiS (DUF1127 family)
LCSEENNTTKRKMIMAIHSIEAVAGPQDLGAARETAKQSRPFPGIGALFSRLVRTIKLARERRAAIAQLRSFDRQQLADIGITRDEIEEVVRTGQSRRMKQGL